MIKLIEIVENEAEEESEIDYEINIHLPLIVIFKISKFSPM